MIVIGFYFYVEQCQCNTSSPNAAAGQEFWPDAVNCIVP